jgi:outer membrane protein TolC
MQLTRIVSGLVSIGVAFGTMHAAESKNRPLSLEECIQLAIQHNLDVQIQRLTPQMAKYALNGAYAAYDPAVSASARHSSSSSPGGIDAQGRVYPSTQQEIDSFDTGLSGLLPVGLSYSLGGSMSDTYGTRVGSRADWANAYYQTNRIEVISPFSGFMETRTLLPAMVPSPDPFENSSGYLGIRLTQPLLKNFWIDGARMNIAFSRKNLKMSELAYQYQIMQTVTGVMIAYYDLIAGREQVKVQQMAMELAEKLLSENRKRVEVGVMAPLDEKQAESQVSASRAALLAAQSSLTVRENSLKNLITDKYTEWRESLEPTESLTATVQVFNRQDSWQKGMTMRPDLLQSRLDLEKQQIRLRYDRNQLFPQLDLTGSYGQSGSAKEFSGALGAIENCYSPSFSYGAVLTIPLSNRAARNNYRTSKAQLEQVLLRLKKLEQSILVEIDDAIAMAQTSLQRVDATKQARLYAEAALEAEQKKLENGKSTSFQVLQFQRDVTMRRSEEISALSDYNTSLTRLALSEGSVLERNAIKVEIK